MAFNFGNNPTGGTPGFSFGQPAPATTTAAAATGGFSFGGAAPATGLLQSSAPSAAPTPSFGLGAFSATPSSQPAALNLGGFSLTSTSAAPAFGTAAPAFGTASPAFGTAAPAFGAAAPALGSGAPTLGGTSLVGATSTAAAAPSGFSLGSTATSKPSMFGGVGLNLTGTPAATVAPSLSFGSPAPAAATAAAPAPAATTISSGMSLNFGGGVSLTPAAPTTAAVAAPTSLGAAAFGATPTLSLNLSKPATTTSALPTASAVPSIGTSLFGAKTTTQDQSAAATVTTTTTTAAAILSTTPKLTYATLEAEINKWAYQLEEQENIFIHQATQVNAWDRLLLESGDKIASLNSTMEALKLEQHKLDLELDYIASQERELEDSIGPIEAAVASMQLADPERQQTYEMAESLDGQTKQMANDLKKIITHLNIINKEQDENNPVVQIGRILNAHMNSLLWIHQTASSSQTQMDEASKMIDLLKKELVDHTSLMK